jgi:hypothetical protein
MRKFLARQDPSSASLSRVKSSSKRPRLPHDPPQLHHEQAGTVLIKQTINDQPTLARTAIATDVQHSQAAGDLNHAGGHVPLRVITLSLGTLDRHPSPLLLFNEWLMSAMTIATAMPLRRTSDR